MSYDMNDVGAAFRRLADVCEASSYQGIKARDRIDISLDRYEQLKESVKLAEKRARHMEELFEKIGIPVGVVDYIIPESIVAYFTPDDRSMNRKCKIEFVIKENSHGKADDRV